MKRYFLIKTNDDQYSWEEILMILQEQHRLCSVMNLGEPDVQLTSDTTVLGWRKASDLQSWWYLSEYLNQAWQVNISKEEWYLIFQKEESIKLVALCKLLAKYSTKKVYNSKKLFGKKCLSAGVFLGIKFGLKSRGVDVSSLRPSSLIESYLTEYTSQLLEEITQSGLPVVSRLRVEKVKNYRRNFFAKLLSIIKCQYRITFENIDTFRDLVEKMIATQVKITCQ